MSAPAPTPATDPLAQVVDQAMKVDVIGEVTDLSRMTADDLVMILSDYGPGVLLGLVVFAVLLRLKRVTIGLLRRPSTGKAASSLSGWRYWAVPFIERISPLLLFMLALTAALMLMPISPAVHAVAERALSLVILFQLGVTATTVLSLRAQQMTVASAGRPFDATQVTMFTTLTMVAQIAVWVVVALIALQTVGVNVTTLIAGLGIGGIAIAFAFKSIMEDIFASLSIAFDKPFVMGDFIISGEHMGTVERIGMKNIRIRSLSGEQIVINNNDILQSRIRNYGRMYERRVVFTIGVEYGTPLEKLRGIPQMIRDIVTAQPQTRFDRAHFKDYGPYALNFETVYYILNPDYNAMMDIQQTINLAIYEGFERDGVAFAFPTQTLRVVREGNEADAIVRS